MSIQAYSAAHAGASLEAVIVECPPPGYHRVVLSHAAEVGP